MDHRHGNRESEPGSWVREQCRTLSRRDVCILAAEIPPEVSSILPPQDTVKATNLIVLVDFIVLMIIITRVDRFQEERLRYPQPSRTAGFQRLSPQPNVPPAAKVLCMKLSELRASSFELCRRYVRESGHCHHNRPGSTIIGRACTPEKHKWSLWGDGMVRIERRPPPWRNSMALVNVHPI